MAGMISICHTASPQECDQQVQKWRNRAKRVLPIGEGSETRRSSENRLFSHYFSFRGGSVTAWPGLMQRDL